MGKMQDSMGSENYGKYRDFIRQKESGAPGGQYDKENQFGYVGAYQFGAEALQSQGLLKPGIVTNYKALGNTSEERAANHRAILNNPANWNDPPGSKEGFIANKQLQDQAFDKLSESNYSTLSARGLITPNTPPDQVAGLGAASHLLGATKVADGKLNEKDAKGTSGTSYYQGAAKAVNGSSTAPPPPKPSNSNQQAATNTPSSTPYRGTDRKLKESGIANSVDISGVNALSEDAIPLPVKNPLADFVSHNAIFTFSCISPDAHRDPTKSYKAGNLGEIIFKNSGAGSKTQQTAMRTADNPGGQYDFYMDNLDINSIITYTQQTQSSNATDITFDVMEPYSMGVFMQSCEVAARKLGWPTGYLNAVFLLTIEFVGFTEDSEGIARVIPNTTRHIPMIIKDIQLSVKSSGSMYRVKGHPSNEIALENNYRLFDSDLAVSGKTVQEILQSGEFSLQTIINKRLQELAEKEKEKTTPDEILIVFPKIENASKGRVIAKAAFTGADVTEPNGATNQAPPTIKVTRKDSTSNLIQDSATLNEIGQAKMDFDMSTSGESQVNKQDEAQPDPKKPVVRSKVKFDPKKREFIFSQGTSIINAISSILLNTDYCKKAVAELKADKKGMINWFRIETQIDYQAAKPGNKGNNNVPKLIVYKVVPFKVHTEKISSPTSPAKGYDELRKEAAKVYDYIYTGKNTEVISFELEFKQAFFNTIAVDQNKLHKELFNSGQRSATTEASTAPTTSDNTPIAAERGTGNVRAGRNLSVDPHKGGTTAEDARTVIAKAFQRALYESETDLVIANATIMGDPYYIADSGLGNFSNSGTGRFNITDSGAMDYQSGEVDIIINFRTPLDYDQTTGIMDFGNTEIVQEFSGLYQVTFVTNRFQKGKFTQELKLLRRKRQTAQLIDDGAALAERQRANGVDPRTGQSVGVVVLSEDGTDSGFRKNEYGDLYQSITGGGTANRATANPRAPAARNQTPRKVVKGTPTPVQTDAGQTSVFQGYP